MLPQNTEPISMVKLYTKSWHMNSECSGRSLEHYKYTAPKVLPCKRRIPNAIKFFMNGKQIHRMQIYRIFNKIKAFICTCILRRQKIFFHGFVVCPKTLICLIVSYLWCFICLSIHTQLFMISIDEQFILLAYNSTKAFCLTFIALSSTKVRCFCYFSITIIN